MGRCRFLDSGFAEEVGGVGLLQQVVTDIFPVSQNLVDGARPPLGLSSAGENTVSNKPGGNFVHAVAFHVFPVDTLDSFLLLRVDNKVTIRVFGVAEEAIMIELNMSLLVAVLQVQFDVLARGLTFLLGQRCHNGKEHLAFGIHCIDGIFLKEDGHVHRKQASDQFQAIRHISGKAA